MYPREIISIQKETVASMPQANPVFLKILHCKSERPLTFLFYTSKIRGICRQWKKQGEKNVAKIQLDSYQPSIDARNLSLSPCCCNSHQDRQFLWAYHTAQVIHPILRDVRVWKNPEVPIAHTGQSQLFIAHHGLQHSRSIIRNSN